MTAQFTRGKLHVHSGPDEVAKLTRALRAVGRKVALVPTMGALHAGHRDLLRRAGRIQNTVVVASIFVNPLQFGPNEDFDRYPRPLEADLDVCAQERVEVVFTPERAAMYPPGAQVTVHPGPLGDELEGAARPGHFAGVLTVVAKLLNIVRPDFAFFGEKDYQQLVLIRRMVADLDMDTRVIGVPTVREPDGLALSSRNAYLDPAQRQAATALSAALSAGAHAGTGGAAAVLDEAGAVLAASSGIDVDYLELRDPNLGPAPEHGEARLLVAARVGTTRLIDNVPVLLGA
ncbi:pantoate--beta-alanine ligase [Actinophytocola sp.]|uniref:pantoate--beta-alanine ligase n=1 Tax=Actinophytocola sp. TaxID=1872138 RepID=UPI002D7E7E17|nr:pantoate--beta-alanine ligase [Actinophytocola sp.]HET9141676.1 pantoate--beta-alanine ligase [Actinophytocola sp.]